MHWFRESLRSFSLSHQQGWNFDLAEELIGR
jgi:hypothetical protein